MSARKREREGGGESTMMNENKEGKQWETGMPTPTPLLQSQFRPFVLCYFYILLP